MKKQRLCFRFVTASLISAYLCASCSSPCLKATAENFVAAKAECVMELNSRRVLYESRGDIRLPMASTTKILTAATVLENVSELKQQVKIPVQAVGIEGSSVYLKEGDIYTVEELLYGLMLRSGNDCAVALSLYCSGSVPRFALKMNETAQKAGALASRFENPHGLPCVNHYTTAHDLTLISCYAMQNPIFRTIVSTRYYEPRHWKNKNKMLSLYEGGIGVKTGYTKEAGRCLVSAATRNNMTLVCTVLSCPTTYERSAKLLDDAFAAYQNEKLLSADEVFTLNDGATQAKAGRDFYYPLLKEEKEWIEIKTKELETGKRKKKSGEIVGQFEIYLAKQLLFSGNLYKL
ncbi:MAG: D-alanyl-D-alanine carboxypeptidase [Clostridia bacterium]|nr:D-alanyl-D-alanine carboxypeptidase [Clostridia bacterium]